MCHQIYVDGPLLKDKHGYSRPPATHSTLRCGSSASSSGSAAAPAQFDVIRKPRVSVIHVAVRVIISGRASRAVRAKREAWSRHSRRGCGRGADAAASRSAARISPRMSVSSRSSASAVAVAQ